ncbi:MAG: EAL domain-containing protein [Alphaproteobacteria bacterium]
MDDSVPGHGGDPVAFHPEWGWRYFRYSPFLCCACRRGVVVLINDAGVAMLGGTTEGEFLGLSFQGLIHPDYVDGIDDFLDILINENAPVPVKMIGLGGATVDVDLRCLRGTDGDDGVVLVLARDVTGHLRSAQAIVRSEARYRELVNRALDAMIVCDDGRIDFINAAGLKLLGFEQAEAVVGRHLASLLHLDYRDVVTSGIDHLVGSGAVVPLKILGADGVVRDVVMGFIPLDRGNHRMFMVEARDITDENRAVTALREANENLERLVDTRTRALRQEIAERRKAEETISHQARHDALTGLPNRAFFFERLGQELGDARQEGHDVGLMFIDLDGFKAINDTLGHACGDLLLKETAHRLGHCVREGDVACRLAGDEFTVIMPAITGKDNAARVAQRILDSLARPFDLNGKKAKVSGSIGISLFPIEADDIEQLLHNADVAMYRAKRHGKNCFRFHSDTLTPIELDRQAIRDNLKRGLDMGDFTLWYLPKMDLHGEAPLGLEALLRLQSADLGLVMPSRFMPVLEEDDLITRVGEWAWRNACRQLRRWMDDGLPPFHIAVNLSARQLRVEGFADTVAAILQEEGVDPRLLEIEVTEAIFLADTEGRAANVLNRFHQMGIHVIMDDFGTGSSSLSHLRRLPLDAFKIDRTFVANMCDKEEDARIVSTIISIAHSLGCRAVAEGVETDCQLDMLRKMGCDHAQGYLFSPPLNATGAEIFLREAFAAARPAQALG